MDPAVRHIIGLVTMLMKSSNNPTHAECDAWAQIIQSAINLNSIK